MTADRTVGAAPHRSVWTAGSNFPKLPPLDGDRTADVCIVGAGIAGLSVAWHLLRAGRSVVVLEDGGLGDGMTAMTTAHLASAIDDRLVEIERLHGEQGLRLAVQSHQEAIDRIEQIVADEGIDCGFQRLDGYLFQPPGDRSPLLEQELDAARRAGLAGASMVSRAPLADFDTGPALRFPRQAQFHPLAYLRGLVEAILRMGGTICTGSHADAIHGGRPAEVRARGHVVSAGFVVVATNSPVNNVVAVHTKQAGYTTYAIAARIPPGSVPTALYWDTADPYHYVRVHDDLLIVGGEDHKTGQDLDAAERHARLANWARQRFPQLGPVQTAWAGQVMETIDGLAFLGRNPLDHHNVLIATGDSGMGITHGTIAGMLLTDLVLGRDNPWTQLYDPARKTLRAAAAFTREALNMAAQYADWLLPGEIADADLLPRGEGGILRVGLTKQAVCRDEHGRLHRFSAVCPHLGGLVRWNQVEQTFDCPCHGSRFDCRGHVFQGPANRDLHPVED